MVCHVSTANSWAGLYIPNLILSPSCWLGSFPCSPCVHGGNAPGSPVSNQIISLFYFVFKNLFWGYISIFSSEFLFTSAFVLILVLWPLIIGLFSSGFSVQLLFHSSFLSSCSFVLGQTLVDCTFVLLFSALFLILFWGLCSHLWIWIVLVCCFLRVIWQSLWTVATVSGLPTIRHTLCLVLGYYRCPEWLPRLHF